MFVYERKREVLGRYLRVEAVVLMYDTHNDGNPSTARMPGRYTPNRMRKLPDASVDANPPTSCRSIIFHLAGYALIGTTWCPSAFVLKIPRVPPSQVSATRHAFWGTPLRHGSPGAEFFPPLDGGLW